MDLFSGLMKGLKPLMDVTGVKADEKMQLAVVQGEIMELEDKKRDAYAEIGKIAYNMVKASTWNKEQLEQLCSAVDSVENQLTAKKLELEKVQKLAEEAQRKEEERLAACTCPNCGTVNAEGTRFCQDCGSKLGVAKSSQYICKACGTSNPIEARFCGGCGVKIEIVVEAEVKCPNCNAKFPIETKFCDQCGTRL